jgi:hypothetical protein
MPQRRQVTAPQPLNHHASGRGRSCMTCHDGTRAFGGDGLTPRPRGTHGLDVRARRGAAQSRF